MPVRMIWTIYYNYLCDVNYDDCTRHVKYTRKVIDKFRKRSSRTYLNEIRQHISCRTFKSGRTQRLLVADVVLIRDDQPIPRNKYLKTKRGTIYRLVQKLIPFEILRNRTEAEMEKNKNIDGN